MGCSSGAHSTASRLTYLAQAAPTDCRPGDSSMVCCIKKFPLDPVGSCGATAAEVEDVLNGARVLNEAAQEVQQVRAEDEEAEDNTPEWKRECRRKYVDCQQYDWLGNCHDCFRYCEGQHEWPENLCRRRKRGE